jgi:hypothetical protein
MEPSARKTFSVDDGFSEENEPAAEGYHSKPKYVSSGVADCFGVPKGILNLGRFYSVGTPIM